MTTHRRQNWKTRQMNSCLHVWTYWRIYCKIKICPHILITVCDWNTGCSKKTDPLVYFDDNFDKYGPILTIFSPLQQEIYESQKLSYFSHLTFIMLPLYLAKQTLMLVSMRIFLDHASKQTSMHSSGWNIYLLIYSNAFWCHYYIIIVFARLPFDCPVVVNFLKQTSNTCLRPSLSRKLFY